ncbi:cold-shock protein [Pseudomonas sp. TE3610]
MPVNKQQGTVNWFSSERGFGFITSRDDASSIFVPGTAIITPGVATLTEGQAVKFNTKEGQKGIEATEVELM